MDQTTPTPTTCRSPLNLCPSLVTDGDLAMDMWQTGVKVGQHALHVVPTRALIWLGCAALYLVVQLMGILLVANLWTLF